MEDRREPENQYGRRQNDIPLEALQKFAADMQTHVEGVIIRTVNGKLNALDAKFDAYVRDDVKWKEEAQSFVNLGKIIKNWGVATGWLIGIVLGLASLYAAILAIIELIKKLRS